MGLAAAVLGHEGQAQQAQPQVLQIRPEAALQEQRLAQVQDRQSARR